MYRIWTSHALDIHFDTLIGPTVDILRQWNAMLQLHEVHRSCLRQTALLRHYRQWSYIPLNIRMYMWMEFSRSSTYRKPRRVALETTTPKKAFPYTQKTISSLTKTYRTNQTWHESRDIRLTCNTVNTSSCINPRQTTRNLHHETTSISLTISLVTTRFPNMPHFLSRSIAHLEETKQQRETRASFRNSVHRKTYKTKTIKTTISCR